MEQPYAHAEYFFMNNNSIININVRNFAIIDDKSNHFMELDMECVPIITNIDNLLYINHRELYIIQKHRLFEISYHIYIKELNTMYDFWVRVQGYILNMEIKHCPECEKIMKEYAKTGAIKVTKDLIL